MPLRLGSLTPSKLFLGSTEVTKAYLGTTEVYSSSQLWTPAVLGPALALWLDAEDASTIILNGNTVSQWSDKSGNGRNATQATASLQPTYTASGIGGKPSLTFAPEGGTAQDRLNVAFTRTQNNITTFALARKPSSSGNVKHRYSRVLAFRNTSGNDYNNTNGWIPAFMAQSDAFGGVNPPSIVNYRNSAAITAQSMVYNTPYIIGSTLSGSTGTMRVNGNQTSGTTSATAVNINQMLIGASSDGIDSEMYGDIAEVIVTPVLSLADQQRIEGYLAHKWGLTANLPADHPYKSAPPTVVSPSYDPDAQAYFDRVEGPSGDNQTLETGVKDAINAFVIGCKADGIWNAIKTSAILAGARTLNGALQPLVGTAPTNFNFVAGDYDRKTGLKGNGSTKYLNTNVSPSDGLQNSAHYSTYTTSLSTNPNLDYIGATQTVPFNSFSQVIDNAGTLNITVNSGAGFNMSPGSGNAHTGFFGADRPSATVLNARYNRTNFTTSLSSPTPTNLDYYVFGRNLNGVANRLSDRSHVFYSIGESLNLALLDSRVSTLVTAIGAAIP